MIIKNVDETKQTELMEDINMKQIDNKIKRLAEDEFGAQIRTVERENIKLQQENIRLQQKTNKFEEGIEKLNTIPDLSPEAKKIINSLLVLG